MTTDSKIHPLQKFEAREIHRSLINEAPYNPRVIFDANSKTLGKGLDTFGLLETLVWNETTSNLVGGHQRLKKLDKHALKNIGSLDYTLVVAVVHLSLKEEIEANILLNNHRAMGSFDDTLLMNIFKSDALPDIDFDAAGMAEDDKAFYGVTMDLESIPTDDVDETIRQFEAVKQQKKEAIPPEIAAQRKEAVKAAKQQSKSEVDTYVTLTFSSQATKREFMQHIGEEPNSLFIKGEIFVSKYFAE